MVYDKAKYHYDGDFPKDLPRENGGTHIGMFVAWAIHRGLVSPELAAEAPEEIQAVLARQKTGRELIFSYLDESVGDDELNDEGQAFGKSYYASNTYGKDYEKLLGRDSCYRVEDTWENFDLIAAMIDKRYVKWKANYRGQKPG